MNEEKTSYLLVDTKISDPIAYENYKAAAKPIAEHFGGSYLTRGGKMDIVENELWDPTRIVLVRFPSTDAIYRFLNSPEYAPVKEIRLANAKATMVILEGV